MLETSHGLIALHLRSGLSAAPGSRVVLHHPTYASGAIVSADLARLGPPTVGPPTTATGPADFTPGPRTLLVLVVPLIGQPAVGDEDSIRNIVFTAPNSANAFLQQESFGQVSLTGKLRSDGDVYTVAPFKPLNTKTCDEVLWGNQAESEFLSATAMDPESWDHVMFVFDDPACTFSGEAEIGDIPGIAARHTWINASQTNGVPTTSVLAHELGHNLGVDHAGGFNCGTGASRISFSEAVRHDRDD